MSSVMYNRHRTVRMIHCSSLVLMSLAGNSCLHESSLIITHTHTKTHTQTESLNIVGQIVGRADVSAVFLYW